jgi:L-rhamnose isomerase
MNTPSESQLRSGFELARDRYADLGVDAAGAIARLLKIPISVHCWQGDDVRGFENATGELGGGLAVTGSYPGAARTADELRADYDNAFSLIPGRHRVNLHAIYAETGPVRVSRDALAPEHFARWTDWARDRRLGIDFNPTCFAHPMASSGFTLASADAGVRRFWVDHCRASRLIAAAFGAALGSASVCNVWIPDGYKDTPADRLAPRRRLRASLDEVFADRLEPLHLRDSVEGKLFGIGTESYTVGSHEFYLGYAASRPGDRRVMVCLDAGPTGTSDW